jgi:hypothetical protein
MVTVAILLSSAYSTSSANIRLAATVAVVHCYFSLTNYMKNADRLHMAVLGITRKDGPSTRPSVALLMRLYTPMSG